MKKEPLILASGSPRRRQLMEQAGYEFLVRPTDADENAEGHARDLVVELSRRKARAAVGENPGCTILAADTLVSLDGVPLGKPQVEGEAFRMLKCLSGRTHQVYTGVCVIRGDAELAEAAETGVRFRALTDEEILAYIATGEPMDKAGAYAIQGGAGAFVEEYIGPYDNVIGLPMETVAKLLRGAGYQA